MDYFTCIDSIHKKGFELTALEVFKFQYNQVPVYQEFCNLLNKSPENVSQLTELPFLPISLFKQYEIKNTKFSSFSKVFTSSGTTSSRPSQHFIPKIEEYEANFKMNFEHFYGPMQDYVILGLLPSYLERSGSSLIYMVNHMINQSKFNESGFFLNNYDELLATLMAVSKQGKKCLLIGVSFALLEFAENYSQELHQLDLSNLILMETGGMKGKRKEIIREELHQQLKFGFGKSGIASEYGMTEMLSQSYAIKNGVFECPPSLQFMLRDTEDPLNYVKETKVGGINFIDLANVSSLSFVATQDLGKQISSNTYEVLGRFDHSDIRGCNLMMM